MYLRVVLGCDVGDRTAAHRSLRAVWSDDLGYAEVDPGIVAIARAKAHLLSDTGAVTLVDGDVRLRDPAAAWTALRTPGTWNDDAAAVRADNDARLAEVFTTTDLLLTPTTPYTAHGHDGPGDALSVSLTWGFNLSGHPALTVPAGLGADGLPVGLQIVARHDAEGDLLQAAACLPDVPAVPIGDR